MAGIDRDAERKKEMSNKKEQDIKKRKERSDREVAALLEKETCELSCESSTPEQSDEEYNHVGPRKKKVCQLESQSPNLITKDVAAALDRTKVSDREAVYLLASAAHALGHDVQQLPVSRSSIRRARIEHRESEANSIQNAFSPNGQLLKASEEKALMTFNLFVVEVYVEAWFQAPFSVYAPANDLHLLGQWTSYKNPTLCQATSVAFRRHVWYLSELLVCFALFDERVGLEERERDGAEHGTQFLELRHPKHKRYNVETWKENDHYQEALRIVQGLKVVNDCAERGVKLIQEYTSIWTNDDQQKHTVSTFFN
ncbi:hypothetical protein Bpfe_016784 [Biomphalaria pfeifferi]|uniref:Uncharacterized protein n=1 Tax=Biomphalaria pfeifferi TaxID=112525 RepID=A0AAD8BHT9_BIOPF|nr:hypothetical protein Bpfe_016784 [Biomphalaria pfeifferi]